MGKRVDIKTGFLCNNNCRFCVQAHKKKFGNRPTKDIVNDLKKARKTGCTGVVFTGGEVSIRKDFFELLTYAKKLQFMTIQVQTNARRFSYMDFSKKAVNAGMNEFGPAIHGHIPELHDYLTRSPGSFKQTYQAIKNIRKLDIYTVTNTVVVKPNYRHLPEMAQMLVDLGVNQFQLAFPHPIANAHKNFDQMVPCVSLAAPYIHKGLQVGISSGLKVMAEAMPYCVMKGYEKYVSELYIPQGEIRDINAVTLNWEKVRKEEGKMKFSQCKKCRYDLICEGPWKEYPEKRGSLEFRPVEGKKITKILN
ncbi:radical SAM protein [Candidatus Woesearchaeota archaeon]|nr:radical SAM protein [Candidatus Woesearchaeota archaeon]